MRNSFEMPLLFTASLVILIIQATAQQQQVLYRGANHGNAKFVKHANTKLDVAPFPREKVEDLIECMFSCLQHAQCLSFNMAVKAVDNKYDCLLLSTDKYNKSESLMSTRDFNHHSIASPCESFPCQNRGTCLPIYEAYAYKCSCLSRVWGDNCEVKETVPSEILGNHPEHHKKLAEYLQPVQVSGKQWVLCFRASDHQYSVSAFHAACDNKGPTVTLVQVGDHVFGGYAGKSYDVNVEAHIFSDKAFMFSLKNADGKAYKMAVRQGYEKWAVYSKSGYGPSFGDLVIRNNCHTNTNSYAQPGDDFELPAGYTHDTNQSRSLLAGSLHFKCDEYEVFYQE